MYWRGSHFWAFNVADAAITVGAVLVLLDMIGLGRQTCIPSCLRSAGFPVYTYGVLLAAAYLLGLQFALVRARARGLDANRVMDLGIWIIISALVGAKLLLLIVDLGHVHAAIRRELLTLVRSGGVFYGGLIAAVAVALWYLRRHRLPMWTVDRRVRARHRARPRHRPARLPLRRLLLRQADRRAVGDHVPQRVRRAERRHAARTCRCTRRSSTRPAPSC